MMRLVMLSLSMCLVACIEAGPGAEPATPGGDEPGAGPEEGQDEEESEVEEELDEEDEEEQGEEEAEDEDDQGLDDTEADPLCDVPLNGGGFYAELREVQTQEMVSFLWTESSCALVASWMTYDFSDFEDPMMAFYYEGMPEQSSFALEPRVYLQEDVEITLTPTHGLPPIGPEMGMWVVVYDAVAPADIRLEGLLWAP